MRRCIASRVDDDVRRDGVERWRQAKRIVYSRSKELQSLDARGMDGLYDACGIHVESLWVR